MWLGPALFVVVSMFLWSYVGAVFVPEVLARSAVAVLPVLADVELALVGGLLDKKILIAMLEVPALEPLAFQTLRDDIAAWHVGTARDRWLLFADSLIKCATDFAGTSEPTRR